MLIIKIGFGDVAKMSLIFSLLAAIGAGFTPEFFKILVFATAGITLSALFAIAKGVQTSNATDMSLKGN